MEAWQELAESENYFAWRLLVEGFGFHPSVEDFPGIYEPSPSITYSLHMKWNFYERDTNMKTLAAFRRCCSKQQRLYALNWHHACYWLWPHRPFDSDNPASWHVPVEPNGDYIFLAEDASFGIFGHPWEETMCVWGQPLLDAFALDMPLLFTEIVRENR